ncbi:hypothetical protein A2U01_0041473, partial [Trifolium medium]|nr:hypothetical protein [Trifolium medium]
NGRNCSGTASTPPDSGPQNLK